MENSRKVLEIEGIRILIFRGFLIVENPADNFGF